MAEKAGPSSAPPPNQQQYGMPEAPPSYEATMSGSTGDAGGFKPPGGGRPYPQQQQAPPHNPTGPSSSAKRYPCHRALRERPQLWAASRQHGLSSVSEPDHDEHGLGARSHGLDPGRNSLRSWIVALRCIPCCIESLNSVTHKCPQCKNFLGRYKGGM